MNQRINVKKGAWQSICQKEKSLLVRIDDRIFARFATNNLVVIASGERACTCRILAIRRYNTLEEILDREDLTRIAHGSHQETHEYLSGIYHDVPSTHRFVVLELELVKIGRQYVR